MNYSHLSDTERAVLTLIEENGVADQHDILSVLDPDLGMYYIVDVLETLYNFNLIREVDVGRFAPCAVPEAA